MCEILFRFPGQVVAFWGIPCEHLPWALADLYQHALRLIS